MPAVKGKWRWREAPGAYYDTTTEYVDFTSKGVSCGSILLYESGGFAYYSADGDILFPSEDAYYRGQWLNGKELRLIDFGETPQEVSDEFYAYLKANAINVSDITLVNTDHAGVTRLETKGQYCDKDIDVMVCLSETINIESNEKYDVSNYGQATVNVPTNGWLVGKWQFKEVLSRLNRQQIINFSSFYSSNGREYRGFGTDAYGVKYFSSDGTFVAYDYSDNEWSGQEYRIVDFGETPQEVSREFLEWFMQNALPMSGIKGGYTVTFMANDEVYQIVSVHAGGSITEPIKPTPLSGFVFDGWGVEFPYTPTSDTTLTAQFTQSLIGTWLFNETIPAFPTKITTSVKGTFSAKQSTSSTSSSLSYTLSTYNINQIIFATSTYVVEIKDSTNSADCHTTRYNINSSQWESQCMSGGSGSWKPYTASSSWFTQVRTITITEDPNDATFAEYLRASATKIA